MNETAIGLAFINQSSIDEADEEFCGAAGLTDAEILDAFFKEGCDLDGTPLCLIDDYQFNGLAIDKNRTLH